MVSRAGFEPAASRFVDGIALIQLSYRDALRLVPKGRSNHRRADLQPAALPLSYFGHQILGMVAAARSEQAA